MRVLVTGIEGYIGSVLAPLLIERGHTVVGLDTGFYRESRFYEPSHGFSFELIDKDVRRVTESDLKSVDGVVHLAELSNDPLGQLNPRVTYGINHKGTVRLAKKCKKLGIERFVYMSSCSVYGRGSNAPRRETDKVDPQTPYARCKVLVERDVGRMADDNFSPTFLRNATAYGPSPRMRFDLVLNNLAGCAWTTGEVRLASDGTPWRPLVHLSDICEAIEKVLIAPRQVVHNQTFNVGDNGANYRVREIAEIVAEHFPVRRVIIGAAGGDNRSYRVSFDKIHSRLPGFQCFRSASTGARELAELFGRIAMGPETFEARAFTRLKKLEHLITAAKLDKNLFWRREVPSGEAGAVPLAALDGRT